jgi:integrase
MSLYQRGETWYIYLTYDGQRIRETTNTTDKKKAEAIHDARKIELRTRKESGKTLADAIKLWLTASQRSDSELSEIKSALTYYPNRPLSQVDGHDFQDAFADKSPGTYNRIANNIRAAINLAHKRGWCELITIPRKKIKSSKTRFLSKAEWARLESELPEHLRPIAQFAISTGLRRANVLQLKWAQIDMQRAVAYVDATDAKGDASIPVPLSKYALDVLKSQQGKHKEYVFTYQGNPIGVFKSSWKKALLRAKIDVVQAGKDKEGNPVYTSTFRWHDLRHTWASWHIQNGTPLAVLKELGGWHDISMVLRYAHLAPDHLAKYASNAVA